MTIKLDSISMSCRAPKSPRMRALSIIICECN